MTMACDLLGSKVTAHAGGTPVCLITYPILEISGHGGSLVFSMDKLEQCCVGVYLRGGHHHAGYLLHC